MDKLDKVIKGFEKCLNPNSNCYHNEIGCPYENQCWLSDSLPARPLKEEALELMNEYKVIKKTLEACQMAVNRERSLGKTAGDNEIPLKW